MTQTKPNKSPKPTLESIVALRGSCCGGAAWLKRYVLKRIDEASESNSKNVERVDRNGLTRKLHSRLAG